MTDVLFTRDSFISNDHVRIAIEGLKTIWSQDGVEGDLKEVPMPPSIKETGLLPEGYCVGMSFCFIIIIKNVFITNKLTSLC